MTANDQSHFEMKRRALEKDMVLNSHMTVTQAGTKTNYEHDPKDKGLSAVGSQGRPSSNAHLATPGDQNLSVGELQDLNRQIDAEIAKKKAEGAKPPASISAAEFNHFAVDYPATAHEQMMNNTTPPSIVQVPIAGDTVTADSVVARPRRSKKAAAPVEDSEK